MAFPRLLRAVARAALVGRLARVAPLARAVPPAPRMPPLLLSLLGLLALVGCDRGLFGWWARPPENVLLVVVDTLRADHLGLYGYDRPTSPNLDRLAASAVVFERARSQAACTFPSVNSILSSRYGTRFLGQGFANFTIPDGTATVAAILQERGYATFAASASGVVRATPSKVNPRAGFGRGFERFDESCLDGPASCINGRFREFLDGQPSRFFAYLHYMEPHHPYAPPPEYHRQFALPRPVSPWALAGNPDPIEKELAAGRTPEVKPADLSFLVDLYDDEIAYWDSQLVLLLADLRERGLLNRTLVILAADHGEMFLEHGDIKHCRGLWDTVTRTPLVFWIPGQAGARVAEPVENVDIVPTALDYLGLDPQEFGFDGRSLKPVMEGAEQPQRALAFSMQSQLRSVNDARFKLIFDMKNATAQLYDLPADPTEQTNRVDALPEVSADLQHTLAARIAEHEGADAAKRGAKGAETVEKSLRALGYLQ